MALQKVLLHVEDYLFVLFVHLSQTEKFRMTEGMLLYLTVGLKLVFKLTLGLVVLG